MDIIEEMYKKKFKEAEEEKFTLYTPQGKLKYTLISKGNTINIISNSGDKTTKTFLDYLQSAIKKNSLVIKPRNWKKEKDSGTGYTYFIDSNREYQIFVPLSIKNAEEHYTTKEIEKNKKLKNEYIVQWGLFDDPLQFNTKWVKDLASANSFIEQLKQTL